jgi:ATP-dependent DNA helicase RecG
LRGRVGRGTNKSYCLLFTESTNKKVKDRLEAMTKIRIGRELAEIDLQSRGPGEVFGTRQHGYSELKYADWSDIVLIKKTNKFAQEVIENQEKYQNILNYYKSKQPTAN